MFHKEWQVCLTYLTQRWVWFFGLIFTVFVFQGYSAVLDGGRTRHEMFAIPLAMPILIGGGLFLVSAVKWQFANPRTRLIPGYAQPHLLILGTILAVVLVLNPLLYSIASGVLPWGLLAFTLLQGGGYLWAVGANLGWLMIPLMAVFFSSTSEAGRNFWLSDLQPFMVLHGLLIILGSAAVVGWLWRLVNLDEEMPDYQVTPLAGWGRPSRLESAEARKLVGRQAAKQGLYSWLSDLWHDRLPLMALNSAQCKIHFRYGFGRLSPRVQAVWSAILLFTFIAVLRVTQGGSFVGMPLAFALAGPGVLVLMHLRQRQGRMPQELLAPLSREDFFNGLWRALAWEMFLIWLALTVSLAALVGFGFVNVPELTLQSAAGFAVFSAALLLPTFGVALRLARIQSAILLGVGGYAVLGAQVAWLTLWWKAPPVIDFLIVVFTVVLGVVLINWSRRQWLDVELG